MPARGKKAQWVSLGASVRLQQLDQERAEIIRAFPHLKKPAKAGGLALVGRKNRRPMSAAARKAMSAGMRKYWARRKAEDAKSQTKRRQKIGITGR
jgi:hypothetical protein